MKAIKFSRNSWLIKKNGKYYLRRKESSRINVVEGIVKKDEVVFPLHHSSSLVIPIDKIEIYFLEIEE